MVSGIVAVVIGLLALYGFLRYSARPYTWRVLATDLGPYLDRLLRRGYNGSFVLIEEPGTGRFVQFAKYIKRKGDIGLELGFPRTTWSEPYFRNLQEYLVANDIPFKRQPVATPPTTEYLDVDCGTDTAKAFRIADAILTSMFQTPPSTRLKVRFSHLALYDELIDQ
jgi:hypothetical protein